MPMESARIALPPTMGDRGRLVADGGRSHEHTSDRGGVQPGRHHLAIGDQNGNAYLWHVSRLSP
jgi:hypothetical protein